MAKRGAARIGDTISHGGEITSASPTATANGRRIARFGDTAQCSRHGTVTITTSSSSVKANSRGVARIRDALSCGARITSASLNVFIGDVVGAGGLLADNGTTPLTADNGAPLIA